MSESAFIFVCRVSLNLLSYSMINLFKNRNDLVEQFYQMLNLQLSVLMYLLIGGVAYKTKIITDENRTQFIHLILSLLMPMLVFNSFKKSNDRNFEIGVMGFNWFDDHLYDLLLLRCTCFLILTIQKNGSCIMER